MAICKVCNKSLDVQVLESEEKITCLECRVKNRKFEEIDAYVDFNKEYSCVWVESIDSQELDFQKVQ